MNSSEIEWWTHDNEETFYLLTAGWNVQKAKRIIEGAPREVEEADVRHVIPLLCEEEKLKLFSIVVDWKIVRSGRVNLAVPIIIAERDDKTFIPIDGWHRIAKAKLDGLTSLPCVLLTREESRDCEL